MVIRDEIIKIIERSRFVNAEVEDDSNLYMDLGFDSLSFIQLLLVIENKFSIRFSLLEMDTCLQVERLIELVTSKLDEKDFDQKTNDE